MIFDKTFEPKINGATQRVRMIAEGSGLPLNLNVGPTAKWPQQHHMEKDK